MTSLLTAFSYLNDFFDHIYVITLHRATDRQKHFEKELEGLRYSVFFGQDKNDFTIEDLVRKNIFDDKQALKNHRYHKPMPAGMIGCSWSHRLVYEDMLKNNYRKVLIMEDDIVINQKTIRLVPGMLQELPNNWELCYFGFAVNEQPPTNALLKKSFYHLLRFLNAFKLSHKAISNLYPKQISQHIYKSGNHDCTHAYAITASGAEKLRALQTPIVFWPDHLLAYAATNEIVRSYIMLPKVIDQIYQVSETSTHSYIHQ